MRFIIKLVLMAIVVLATSHLLPFITINGLTTAIILVVVLSILNAIIKPLLIILTIPITLVTFGLFLLVINGLIILLADFFISGFNVHGLFNAIIFSLILSVAHYLIDSLVGKK